MSKKRERDGQTMFPLAEVPKVPWLPRPVHLSTVYHWTKRGRRGVQLRTVRSVGGLYCTEQWLREFFQQISPNQAERSRTPGEGKAKADRAKAALEKAGF